MKNTQDNLILEIEKLNSSNLFLNTEFSSWGWNGLLLKAYWGFKNKYNELTTEEKKDFGGFINFQTKSKFGGLRFGVNAVNKIYFECEKIKLEKDCFDFNFVSKEVETEIINRLTEKNIIKESDYEMIKDFDLIQENGSLRNSKFEKIKEINEYVDFMRESSELLSDCCCEFCGRPGYKGGSGWLITACNKCHKSNPEAKKNLYKNDLIIFPDWVYQYLKLYFVFLSEMREKSPMVLFKMKQVNPEDLKIENELWSDFSKKVSPLLKKHINDDISSGLRIFFYPFGEKALDLFLSCGADLRIKDSLGCTIKDYLAKDGKKSDYKEKVITYLNKIELEDVVKTGKKEVKKLQL